MSRIYKYTITFPDVELTLMASMLVEQAYSGPKDVNVTERTISVDAIDEVVEDLHCMGVYDFHITANPASLTVPTPPSGKHTITKGDLVSFTVGTETQTSAVYDIRRVGFWPRTLQYLLSVDDKQFGHGLTWMEAKVCHPVSPDVLEA